jgi:hypothetical protein
VSSLRALSQNLHLTPVQLHFCNKTRDTSHTHIAENVLYSRHPPTVKRFSVLKSMDSDDGSRSVDTGKCFVDSQTAFSMLNLRWPAVLSCYGSS